jgi:hypothetical protein
MLNQVNKIVDNKNSNKNSNKNKNKKSQEKTNSKEVITLTENNWNEALLEKDEGFLVMF